MFEFFRKRLFQSDVIETIKSQLLVIHGEEMGGECVGAFATAILNAQQIGDMPKDLLDQLRESGLSVSDAAIAFFDASITAIKRATRDQEIPADIQRLIANMESALDRMFLKNPGKIAPRNGAAGPALKEWTT